MSIREHLASKLESQIDAWQKQIDAQKAAAVEKRAEAKTEEASARLKDDLMDQVHGLQNKIDEARKHLHRLQDAGEEKLEDIKREVGKLLH